MSTALLRGHRWGDDPAGNDLVVVTVPVDHRPSFRIRPSSGSGPSLEVDDDQDLLALAWAGLVATRCGLTPQGWTRSDEDTDEARHEEITTRRGRIRVVTSSSPKRARIEGRMEDVEALAWHGAWVLHANTTIAKGWSA